MNEREMRNAVRAEYKVLVSSGTVDDALQEAYARLPETVKKKRSPVFRAVQWAGATAAVFAAGLVILAAIGIASPAIAAELPIVGRLFRQYNHEEKTAVGTYIDTYGKVQELNASAVGDNAGELALTAREVYSDGKYLHMSFTMEAPEEYLEKYYYLSMPLQVTANGEKLTDGDLVLFSGAELFEGTVAIPITEPVGNGEVLSLSYATGQLTGYYNDGADWEDLPGAFAGNMEVTVDTSHNRTINVIGGSEEIKINSVEATPSYTKISYEIPFWGVSGYTVDYPMLCTLDGTQIRGTVGESVIPGPDDIDPYAETISATHFFDGLPSGTEKVVLRFLTDDAALDPEMAKMNPETGVMEVCKVKVLGEVTIDLTTGEAVPSETYLEDGYEYAADFRESFYKLNWHAGFDDIQHREGYPRQMDLYEVEDLFQNGIALEFLEIISGTKITANFMCTATPENDLRMEITVDGAPVAVGAISGMNAESEDNSVSITCLPGQSLKLLDTVTVTLKDADTGETVYQRELRLVRGRAW